MPQSLLERGANTILNAGGWNNSPNAITQTLALADALVISEAFATVLTPGLVKSVLSRGAYSRLHAGAFIKYITTDITQTLALADILPGIVESVSFIQTSIAVRFSHSMLERGAHTILDGGAPQGTHTGGYKRLVNYPHRKTLIGR